MRLKSPTIATIILSFILLPYLATGQTDYVIRLKGDTLKGVVKILFGDQVDRVQITEDGSKTTFSGLQVRSIRKDNEIYRAVKYENTAHFMKVLIDGYLSLYAFSSANQNTWDGRYLTKLDGTGMEVPNLSFKKMLGKYLSDCQDIKTRIENGDLNKRDMERIVDLYNICIQTKTEASRKKYQDSAAPIDSEKLLAVKNLITKVEAENFLTKKDALDVLKDVQTKVSKNEQVPNYQLDGLKSYLADTPSLSKDLEALLLLLKK